jgi:CheY-like chemotaxis protein
MKIMIVDDNERMRELIRSIACKENDIVLECSGGTEAVMWYPKFFPDAVLMDIEMSDMDGFAAAAKIVERHRAARIIFVTNHFSSAFHAKAGELGAAGFVTKENLFLLHQLLHHQ